MKALVISDIHGSGYYADKIREIVERENPEKIILLGDLYYHGPRNDLSQEYNPMKVAETLNSMKDKLLVIRGNCDAEVDEMISEFKFNDHILMEINGKKFYFTHGHKYNIENIPYDDFDIMIYGHIHQGFIEEKEGLIFANPGSISLPKCNTAHSYIILEDNIKRRRWKSNTRISIWEIGKKKYINLNYRKIKESANYESFNRNK